MVTKYLIDAENLSSKWMHYINQLKPGDALILFYTKSVKGSELTIPIDQLQKISEKGASVEYIRCILDNPEPNALDFQLASELGARLFTNIEDKYIILSRDMGFDIVAAYWQKYGYDITRSDPSLLFGEIDPDAVQTKRARGYYESVCVAAGVNGKWLNTIVDIMMEGMLRPESDCIRYIHNAISERVYPQSFANKTYCKIKDDLHRIKYHGPFPATKT